MRDCLLLDGGRILTSNRTPMRLGDKLSSGARYDFVEFVDRKHRGNLKY